jgi:hypothetical protein
MSHGAAETEKLKANIQDQLSRLLQQLQDLEELRDELEDDEYEETRRDTLEQMEEFDVQLKRHLDGDMTLVSELGQLKLALQAAIKNAFQTPEVIRSFAAREPAALRARLAKLTQEHRLGRLAESAFKSQAVETIVALKRLGEELTADEKAFLDNASGDVRARFEAADVAIGEAAVLSLASQASGRK